MADDTKGPAVAWTASVGRCELASKALKGAINLWDECGSVPKLEELAWVAAEAARAALTYAQDAEKKAFKRLKEAQSQLALPGTTAPEGDEVDNVTGPTSEDGLTTGTLSLVEPVEHERAPVEGDHAPALEG